MAVCLGLAGPIVELKFLYHNCMGSPIFNRCSLGLGLSLFNRYLEVTLS